MADLMMWIIFGIILALLISFIVFTILQRKYKKRPIDYYSFFIMGVIWLVIGLPFRNWTLVVLGAVFTVVGFVNKKKWKQNRVTWNDLTKQEKKLRIWIFSILGVLLLIGLIVYYFVR